MDNHNLALSCVLMTGLAVVARGSSRMLGVATDAKGTCINLVNLAPGRIWEPLPFHFRFTNSPCRLHHTLPACQQYAKRPTASFKSLPPIP